MIKILIIEDEPEWSDALEKAYRALFAGEETDISVRNVGYDAIRDFADKKKYDLLSLDLNLASTAIKDDTGKIVKNISGYDGRSLLSLAHKQKVCNGIVVVSGIHEDDQFVWLDEKEGELREFKRTIHQRLEELFPGKNTIFYKGEIAETIADIIRHKKLIHEVAGLLDEPEYGFYLAGQKWELIFNGKKLYLDDINGFRYLYILMQKGRKLDGLYLYQFSKEKKSEFVHSKFVENSVSSSEDLSPKMGDSIDYHDELNISYSPENTTRSNQEVTELFKQYDGCLYQLDNYANDISALDIEMLQAEIVNLGVKLLEIIPRDDVRYKDIKYSTNLYRDAIKEKIQKYEKQISVADREEKKIIRDKIKSIKTILKNPKKNRKKNVIDSVRSGIKSALSIIQNEAGKYSINGLAEHFQDAFSESVWEYKPNEELPWRLTLPKTE